jgi:hypothetical protein
LKVATPGPFRGSFDDIVDLKEQQYKGAFSSQCS